MLSGIRNLCVTRVFFVVTIIQKWAKNQLHNWPYSTDLAIKRSWRCLHLDDWTRRHTHTLSIVLRYQLGERDSKFLGIAMQTVRDQDRYCGVLSSRRDTDDDERQLRSVWMCVCVCSPVLGAGEHAWQQASRLIVFNIRMTQLRAFWDGRDEGQTTDGGSSSSVMINESWGDAVVGVNTKLSLQL